MRTCPFCAEQIQQAAKICRHCKSDVEQSVIDPTKQPAQPEPRKKNAPTFDAGLFSKLCLAFFMLFALSMTFIETLSSGTSFDVPWDDRPSLIVIVSALAAVYISYVLLPVRRTVSLSTLSRIKANLKRYGFKEIDNRGNTETWWLGKKEMLPLLEWSAIELHSSTSDVEIKAIKFWMKKLLE